MELSQREQLSELVEELTMSGQPQLNQEKMKKIKKICKVSDDCIGHVYHTVMSQLNQEHAEIRLSAFQIASELFTRSHHFRTLLVDNFQEFLELTVETDSEQPLPPPKEVARKLRSLAIQTVQSWQASYGAYYKKLALGYHFLKQVKKVDFQDAEARTVAERRRQEERQSRMERIYKERVEAASKEMEELYQEIEATLTEMESCMKLLFPDYGLSDTVNRSPSNPCTANEYPSGDERPCCSKDVKDEQNKLKKHEREKSREEDKNKDIQKRNNEEKKKGKLGKSSDNEESEVEKSQDGNKQEEKKRGTVEDGDEIKKEKGQGDEEEEKNEEDRSSGDEEEEPFDKDLFFRNSGLISHSYSLNLNLSPGLHVKETEDNEVVVSTVIDLHRLITNKHLPAVQAWVQVFTKAGAEQQLLRRALNLKMSLEAALQKHNELHIDYKTRVRKVLKASSDGEEEEDEDDDDDDFDEVPEKEGYEPHIPEHLRAEYGLDPAPSSSAAPVPNKPPAKRPAAPTPRSTCSASSSKQLKRLSEEEQDPTCAAATLRLFRENLPVPAETSSSVSSSEQKPVDAPVVPFGLDLYYWEQEQPNAGKIIKATSQHQFWVPAEVEEEVENDQLLAESRSRYISFPGNFTPVSHFCRAPVGNGQLCQRQDRLKCPFHGQIIPRDQEGRPCRQEDRLREEEEERRKRENQPDWRDAELMRDIEAATGENLGSDRVGKKGKKKKKYPNLSDLKQSANTSRSRLEKKVFNKSSMRRVAEVMIKADRRKHDKFSNQFNYALK
ncbi:UV-stimulated scaffold protein A isoform X2 [Channa argus]|uniref:UV-stimulated scaffold protein A isoform X2 n=1 Tax=Channa argus TaxID=215402 RepID=UPI0035222DE9